MLSQFLRAILFWNFGDWMGNFSGFYDRDPGIFWNFTPGIREFSGFYDRDPGILEFYDWDPGIFLGI